MNHKILYTLSYIVLLSAFLCMCVVIFWLTYPYKIVEYATKVYPIESPVVEQGQYVLMRSQYKKFLNIQPTVSIFFINGLVYATTEFHGGTEKGYFNHITYVKVPEELPPTKYSLRLSFQFKVNPIRTITIIKDSETFDVIKASDSAYVNDR